VSDTYWPKFLEIVNALDTSILNPYMTPEEEFDQGNGSPMGMNPFITLNQTARAQSDNL
jgi:hypothetical protein